MRAPSHGSVPVLLVLVAVLAVGATGGSGTGASTARLEVGAVALPRRSAEPSQAKLVGALSSLASTARERGAQAAAREARTVLPTRVLAGGNRVRVEIEFTGSTRAVDADPAIRAVGGDVERRYRSLVQAVVPFTSLTSLTGLRGVEVVRAPLQYQLHAVAGEGASAIGATRWQGAGLTGAGVKVAVIDFGFAGFRQRQASGDLPASVTTVDYCGGRLESGEVHGTAVAEIVHEVAPAAQLYLICIDSITALGNAKDYAKAQGVEVVNMSAGFLLYGRGDGNAGATTPDGIIADAKASGLVWANSAGNEGDAHWSGTFSDPDGNKIHNFEVDNEGNNVFIPSGFDYCVRLKWDDWPVTDEDYDLLLVRQSDSAVVDGSDDVQDGTQPPVEGLCYTNTGADQGFWVVIGRFSGSATVRLDLSTDGPLRYVVPQGSITEQAASPAAIAVGATCWQTGALDSYSSRGPTIDGRTKPDITAPADVSSATYGAASGCSAGFAGTSASAPHVAGAAALVLQAFPSYGPAQVQSFLEGRAVDAGPAGKDNDYGAGRLALGILDATPPDSAITAGPSGLTSDSMPSFSFTSSEAGSTFQCRLDGAPFAGCTSPFQAPALADGPHVFDVTAVDGWDNVDPTPASRSFTVDTVAPQTRITAGPPKKTKKRTAKLSFRSSEARSTFRCRLDRKAWATCRSPKRYVRLKYGRHVFRVRATDPAGNRDASPAARTFKIVRR